MYYVYILQSIKDKKCYVGYSRDLKKRLEQHNAGQVKSTKERRPFELVYYEAFKYEIDARRQELFYKTGQGRRVLKNRLISIFVEKMSARQKRADLLTNEVS